MSTLILLYGCLYGFNWKSLVLAALTWGIIKTGKMIILDALEG